MAKYLYKWIALVMIVTLSFSGCSNGLKPNKETVIVNEVEAITEVKVMHRWPPGSGIMGELLLDILTEFDEANEDIVLRIDSVPSSMYEEQLNVRFASGDGPDIYALWPGGRTEAQLRKGDILDITYLWEENDWFNSFSPGVVAGSTHTDGKMYTLPAENKPNTFWYNVAIFEEVGAEVPETWDELMEVARLCKEAGYTPFAVGGKLTRWMPAFWFDFMLLNTAGGEFREDLMWGKESWESEEVYKVFELWKEAIDLGYFNESATTIDSRVASTMIADGEAVMMLQGPWAINYLMEEIADWVPVEDFDLFEFPVIDEGVEQAAEGAILSWAVNANTSEQSIEATERLMTFLGTKASVEYFAKERKTLGSRNDIGIEIYDEDIRPMMERLIEETEESPMYMNFELATLPPVQDAGMDAIIEFLEYPERYKEICAKVEVVSRATFDEEE